MLSVTFIYYYAECHYAGCLYAECRGTQIFFQPIADNDKKEEEKLENLIKKIMICRFLLLSTY
jgi:hypothetical protein